MQIRKTADKPKLIFTASDKAVLNILPVKREINFEDEKRINVGRSNATNIASSNNMFFDCDFIKENHAEIYYNNEKNEVKTIN
jgi:hypothetical protein